MSHPENLNNYDRVVRYIEDSWQESFRMAERIVFEAVERIGFKDDIARDRYLSAIPNLAANLHSTFSSLAQMIQQVSTKEVDNVLDHSLEMVEAVRRRNSEKESK